MLIVDFIYFRTVVAHEKEINVVKYSPNEKLIATGSQDKGIKIWDVKKLENIMTLTGYFFLILGHKRGVWDLSFS